MEKTTVRLEDLCKRFGDVLAVDHVDLVIQPGEFVTLLGPSGCGKTTTLRMIAGLEVPTSGAIYLDGQDYTYTSPEKRPVNMVFQAYALFPHLTIAENISFGPRIKKLPADQIKMGVEEMLRLVQLEGYGPRRPDQLSGGQAQRVALARALINHPKVLLLDEPLGALDLKLRKAMQLELRGIQQRLGMTFVYVTHDQEEAMVMSDRIVLMNKGKIVQIGTPSEIYNHPANEFVSRFIGEANLLKGTIKQLSGECFQIEVDKDIVVTAPAKPGMAVGELSITSVRPEQVTVYSSAEGAPQDWPNVFGGTVKSAIFLGPIIRYHVSLANGQIVIADKTATKGQGGFQIDEEVLLGWETENSVVLPA